MTWVKYQNCYNLRLEHSANWKYLGFYIRDLSIGKYRIRLYCKSEMSKFLYFTSCKIWQLEKKSKFLFSAFGKKWILFLI